MLDGQKTISDSDLVQRLKNRDGEALNLFLRLHGAKLYGVAMKYMRNEHDAEEVMQDALVTIWKKIDTFEGRSAFTSWVYRIAANAALMALRKKSKHDVTISIHQSSSDSSDPPLDIPDTVPLPNRKASGKELEQIIRSTIDSLPEPYCTTVRLRDVDDLSIEEIALFMKTSVSAVKSRLHRGRLALRKMLLPYFQSETIENK